MGIFCLMVAIKDKEFFTEFLSNGADKKRLVLTDTNRHVFSGRDGVIRTHDPLHPMQVRYQAALRPDFASLYQ